MGHLFRSEELSLCHLYLQSEASFQIVSKLGELGIVQFTDLNQGVNSFEKKFVNDVRRCDEMERKLRFLEGELRKDEISIYDDGDNPLAPSPRDMIDLETNFEKLEKDMSEINTNQAALKANFLNLMEMKQILMKAQSFFEEMDSFETDDDDFLIENGQSGLGFVAGVIARAKLPGFERVMWRACHGNAFLRHAEITTPLEDPITGDKVLKNVFIIFFQGEQLKERVKKICDGFMVSLYPIPEMPSEGYFNLERSVTSKMQDLQLVLNQAEDHRQLVLSQVALKIRAWFIKVRKIKAIYYTLNLFNYNMAEKCLIAECWCPVKDMSKIQEALRAGTEMCGSSVPSILQKRDTTRTPPTFNRTDNFTSSFQAIIDAFGVARYGEINPAPFTIITFPFLYGVMFGDIGHGFIMFLFALVLVLREKYYMNQKGESDIFDMTFGGRYMILLMGLFSIYAGFMYNETFSRSLNMFGTAWDVTAMKYPDSLLGNVSAVQLDPVVFGVYRGYPEATGYLNGTGNPYQYGMDPIWQSAENKISFQNSYKMKSAVIMGFVQMLFGLSLALVNHLYFKDKMSIFCEWIPQMIFLWCLVGYLCVIIIYKWLVWKEPNSAPGLLIGLINMFMFTAPSKEAGTFLYNGQGEVQKVIVFVALICLPWMLCARPIVIWYQRRSRAQYSLLAESGERTGVTNPLYTEQLQDKTATETTKAARNYSMQASASADDVPIIDQDQLGASPCGGDEEEPEKDFQEIIILQTIHTIEFSLNCISHTASYLRLWALSLAHSELSEVLWKMVIHIGLAGSRTIGPIMLFITFAFFGVLTVAILLAMEGLSAFLHALRLHWVEFQSKFYHGDGYPFTPFSFEAIREGRCEE